MYGDAMVKPDSRDADTPQVSVIVPFRDARPYLARCIDSLLAQTLADSEYELLFVNNNSADGGELIVADYPMVTLLNETTAGAYAARNCALRVARGAIVAFTDPDCVVERDWLERALATLQAPAVGIVLGQRLAPSEVGMLPLVMAYESAKTDYITSSGRAERFYGHTNNMAVKREILDELGPFPLVQRGGDTILVRRAVDAHGCAVVRYCAEMRVRHLEVKTLAQYYDKTRKYGESNQRLTQLVPFRPLSARERWIVFRRTVRERNWSPLKSALLLAALLPGALFYEWGRRLRGR